VGELDGNGKKVTPEIYIHREDVKQLLKSYSDEQIEERVSILVKYFGW